MDRHLGWTRDYRTAAGCIPRFPETPYRRRSLGAVSGDGRRGRAWSPTPAGVPVLLLAHLEAGHVVLGDGCVAVRGGSRDPVPRVDAARDPTVLVERRSAGARGVAWLRRCGRAEALLRWLTLRSWVGGPAPPRAADQPRGRQGRNEDPLHDASFPPWTPASEGLRLAGSSGLRPTGSAGLKRPTRASAES